MICLRKILYSVVGYLLLMGSAYCQWAGKHIAVVTVLDSKPERLFSREDLAEVKGDFEKNRLPTFGVVLGDQSCFFEVNLSAQNQLKNQQIESFKKKGLKVEVVSVDVAHFFVKNTSRLERFDTIEGIPEEKFHRPVIVSKVGNRKHTGELIVKYKKSKKQDEQTIKTSKRRVDEHFARRGSRKTSRALSVEDTDTAAYSIASPMEMDALIEEISEFEGLEYVQPNFVYKPSYAPNDTLFISGDQAALHTINMTQAWDIQRDASWVKVAVVDTGIAYDLVDLAQNMWVNPNSGQVFTYPGFNSGVEGVNGINIASWEGNDSFPTNNPYDASAFETRTRLSEFVRKSQHGSLVAGIIGAVTNNGFGIAGVAVNPRLMNVKVVSSITGFATSRSIAAGLRYARERGAHVVNLAIEGGRTAAAMNGSDNLVLYELNELKNANIPVVVPAGNDIADIDSTPLYPACFNLYNMITVGACDSSSDNINQFGTGKYSIDVFAPGRRIFGPNYGQTFDWAHGTSFASAHVAGALALLKAKYPSESAPELLSRIRNSCNVVPNLKNISLSGGVVKVDEALKEKAKITNISTRCLVRNGAEAAVMGFVISGAATTKEICVRGIGPSLSEWIPSGLLNNPRLLILNSLGQVVYSNSSIDSLTTGDRAIVNSYWVNKNLSSLEAGLVVSLHNGTYYAVLEPENGSIGIGLVELYDRGGPETGRLINVSTRCYYGTGVLENPAVGVTVVSGLGRKAVFARAIGPGLGLPMFGVGNVLPDPILTAVTPDSQITNDNWGELGAAFARRTGSIGFSPYHPFDSAVLAMAPTGPTTFNIVSKTGAAGNILIDVQEF